MNCSNLTTINLPNCTYIGSNAFYSCTNLSMIDFSNCSYIGSKAFYGCHNLLYANFQQRVTIGSSAFGACSNLSCVKFQQCSYIGSYAFTNCSKLQSIYILDSAVPFLYSYVFGNTPLINSTFLSGVYGSIYVRKSLLFSFKLSSGWSVYSSRFVGLTDEEIANLPF